MSSSNKVKTAVYAFCQTVDIETNSCYCSDTNYNYVGDDAIAVAAAAFAGVATATAAVVEMMELPPLPLLPLTLRSMLKSILEVKLR